jgi:TPR repeat protein
MSSSRRVPRDSSTDWSLEPDLAALRNADELWTADPVEGVRALGELASRGSPQSMLRMGWAFERAEGVERDLERAETWYRAALRAGCLDGGYYLGRLLERLERYPEAATAYENGVESDHPPSIFRLGILRARGLGVGLNLMIARSLLERAVALGHVRAMGVLGGLLGRGRFGVANIPRGIFMATRSLFEAAIVGRRAPYSELLR